MTASALDKFCGSKFWDYNEVWNTTNPDLSECFQKTVLVWVPCGFLWILAPFELHYIFRKQKHDRIIPWTCLLIFKILLGILLIVNSAADLLEMLRQQSQGVEFLSSDMWPPVIRSLTFLLATLFIYGNKRAGHHTSGNLFCFWLLMVIATTVSYRSGIMHALDEDTIPDTVFFVTSMISLPLLIVQLILSSFSDCVIDKRKDVHQCPLETASFLSQYFYKWFDKLAWTGFRRSIEREDLWTLLPEYRSSIAYEEYDYYWSKAIAKYQDKSRSRSGRIAVSSSESPKQPSVTKIIWKMIGLELTIGLAVMVVSNVIQFVSPLVLQELIAFVATDGYIWQGILFAVVIFIGALLQSIFLNNHVFRMQSIGVIARAAIIAAIYRKSLRMSSAAKRMSTTGEIVNLMSVDAQRIMDCFQYLGWVASTPIMLGGALYLLWNLLGPSIFAGVVIMLVMIPVNAYLAGKISKMQAEMMRLKDKRTKLMNEVLGGMKVLKLYAWELSFYKQIDEIRKAELVSLKKILYLQSFTSFVFQLSPFLISLSTFGTYLLIDENNYLDATKAFVSLSLFDIIRIPISIMPTVIAMIVQTWISFKRVDKFMANEDIDESNVSHDPSEECPVVIEKGTFAWTSLEDPVLKNINVKIPEGALVAVVGTVGAGKSSFLSAIIGEMEKRTGRVNVKGTLAYVAQQAWIQNATLKDNITFGKTFNKSQYNKVVEACSLKPDIEILPGGDQTEIGEKGINLSGGQKQRVSLARAVYNDADVYLLDDPLSAVDAHVGKHIFEHVLGPKGLLRKKTRILVTHGISYLPQVDLIIVLNGGTITEIGTFQELLKGGGAFSEILLMYLKEQEHLDEIEEEELLEIQEGILTSIEDPELKRRISVGISRALSSDEESISEGKRYSRSNRSLHRLKSIESIKENLAEEKLKMQSKLINVEQMETGKVDWAVYFHYFRSIGLSLFIITLLVFALSWVSSVGSSIWLSQWSQDPPPINGTHDTKLRDLRLGVYGGLGLSQAFFSLLGTLALVVGTIKASKNLHNLMLFNVLRSPMSFFDTTPLGRILNRFSRDVDVTDITIPTFIRPVIDYLFQLIGTLVVISSGVPIFLAAIPPLGIFYYCIQRFFIDTSRQLRRLESVSRSPIYTHFSETIGGLSTIRAFRHQDDFIKISEERVDENHVYFYPFLVAKRWLGIRLEFVGGITVFCASLFSVLNRDTLDPGVVGLVITYSLSVTFLLTWTVRTWTELESNIVSVERMKEYSETPTESEWNGKHPVADDWPANGVIEFDSYATQYREGLELVLKGINCNINSGEKIGIVGRTGAGKSSLTLALFRIIESVSGKITIDGIDISKIGLHDLRSQLTIIPQDPVLFSGTLRLNLDPFEKYSDNQLWQALEYSHLKDFVTSLPAGLSHEIIEGGENLSVGQRQLVCLARAILRKTKILILDEATAAIDLETDDLIQTTIRKEFADCTVITIAHRLNTIMDSTRVMVLSQGLIKEFDSPANLIANKNSEFYSMAEDAGLV